MVSISNCRTDFNISLLLDWKVAIALSKAGFSSLNSSFDLMLLLQSSESLKWS
jgi:hypothetical protein